MLPITKKGEPDYKFMYNYMKNIEMKQINQYKAYLEKIENVNSNIIKERLNELEWGEFYIKDVFKDIERGKRLTKANFIDGKTPFISSSAENNGVDSFIGNNENVRKFENCLTLANSGSVGSTFYHPYEFVASDHVTHLKNTNLMENIVLQDLYLYKIYH